MGNNGKNWLLSPGISSQSEGYSSKWLIWLVCREPLILYSRINLFIGRKRFAGGEEAV